MKYSGLFGRTRTTARLEEGEKLFCLVCLYLFSLVFRTYILGISFSRHCVWLFAINPKISRAIEVLKSAVSGLAPKAAQRIWLHYCLHMRDDADQRCVLKQNCPCSIPDLVNQVFCLVSGLHYSSFGSQSFTWEFSNLTRLTVLSAAYGQLNPHHAALQPSWKSISKSFKWVLEKDFSS